MSRADRPVISLSWTPADRMLEIAALLVLFGILATIACFWPRTTGPVPLHIELDGTISRWGSKYWLLILPCAAAAMHAFLTWLAGRPHLFEYPVTFSPASAEKHYRLGRRMLAWVKLGTIVLLAYLNWEILGIAANPAQAPHSAARVGVVIAGFVLLILGFGLWAFARHRRLERAAS